MPDMNCTEFEALLEQAVENRQSPGDALDDGANSPNSLWRGLRARANACSHCRALWNEFALLESVLPVWKEHVPPVNLTDAVMSRWNEERESDNPIVPSDVKLPSQSASKLSNRRFYFATLMVLTVAIVAGLSFFYFPKPNAELPPTVPVVEITPETVPIIPDKLAETSPDNGHSENEAQAVSWQNMAQDAGSAYWVLAADAADSLASVSVFVPPRKPVANSPKAAVAPANSPWVKDLRTGLKPIGQDVSRAMEFLLDVLPGNEPTL